ncbi:MAG: hypothetical protein Q4A58_01080 [Fusobacterium sp.]|uniref:hypothetical protein n=1 Tax=Fusobacterium sp. TaxID=68766 RepID=UPI0026DC248A|nr:hypothetical protein [Fusobacterium sp.]MDO4689875.1 hypothetical protein [Fusobacterium sp.]
MERYSIKNREFLDVNDVETEKGKSYGFTQEWFKDDYQVLAGCGATVASTILTYYEQCKNFKKLEIVDVLPKMEELWKYLPPIKGKGLNSTKLFYDGILKYFKDRNIDIKYSYIDIDIKNKISLEEIISYLKNEISNNRPVAFLNLCNGEENILDKWHWVTVYELFKDNFEGKEEYFLKILDDREIKKINLSLWYRTIKNDGGFVSFYF